MDLNLDRKYNSFKDVENFVLDNDDFILYGDYSLLVSFYNRFTKEYSKKIYKIIVRNEFDISEVMEYIHEGKKIIVCSWRSNQINDCIVKNGGKYCFNFISFIHIYFMSIEVEKDGMGVEFIKYFQKNRDKFDKVYEIIDDDSKNKFLKILKLRLNSLNPEYINLKELPWTPECEIKVEQNAKLYENFTNKLPKSMIYPAAFCISADRYQYKNKVTLNDKKCILDIGAYDCCTSVMFDYYSNGAKIYAFEPQKEVYNNNIKIAETFSNIIPINKGIWDKSQILYLNNNKKPEASLSLKKNDNSIEVISIDEFCKNNSIKPDFIKMDIEGSELKAIRGGARTIKRYKPDLAICIYHYVSDLCEIPLLLKHLVPEYKIYIDHKYFCIGESVCFASVD